MSHKDGFDSNKRWGNSASKGHGVNSPAMMEARKNNHAKSKALNAVLSEKGVKKSVYRHLEKKIGKANYKHERPN